MAPQTPSGKGNALEDAVRAIETAIIRSFPGYSDSAFRIEGKKIVKVAGVHHELDLYVRATMGPGYESVFVFECKNWRDKVGKNEIVVFSEKVKAVSAQRGFFVAKSFTSDATAQAALDPRLELLSALEFDPSAVMVPAGFHAIGVGKADASVGIYVRGASPGTGDLPIDLSTATFELDGQPMDLRAFVDAWVDRSKHRRCDHFQSALAAEGVHRLEFSDEQSFASGQAIVNGQSLATMKMTGSVEVEVSKAVVVSAFEVGSRGRVVTVQVGASAVQLTASFIQLPATGGTA